MTGSLPIPRCTATLGGTGGAAARPQGGSVGRDAQLAANEPSHCITGPACRSRRGPDQALSAEQDATRAPTETAEVAEDPVEGAGTIDPWLQTSHGVGPLTRLPEAIANGQTIPYTTLCATLAKASGIREAGTGLFACTDMRPFTWIGFYPGKVTSRRNRKRASHTMGVHGDEAYIIGDDAITTGVHMINEASSPHRANVFYAKLVNGYVLYFTGVAIAAGEELLTCYSRSYGKRRYPVPSHCADPRCRGARHRTESALLEEWRKPLSKSAPPAVPRQLVRAAGFEVAQ